MQYYANLCPLKQPESFMVFKQNFAKIKILEMMMIMCDEHSKNTKLFWGSVNKELYTNLKNTFLWFFVGFKSREIVSWFS